MTWAEFVKAVEAAGVQPTDEMNFIDTGKTDVNDLEVLRTVLEDGTVLFYIS